MYRWTRSRASCLFNRFYLDPFTSFVFSFQIIFWVANNWYTVVCSDQCVKWCWEEILIRGCCRTKQNTGFVLLPIRASGNVPGSYVRLACCQNKLGPFPSWRFCMEGMGILLYWALMMDFTILSMRISSFVMVCGRVLQEVGLFLKLVMQGAQWRTGIYPVYSAFVGQR